MVELPAAELGFADVPLFALAIGRQDKRAFARANQHSYTIHGLLLHETLSIAYQSVVVQRDSLSGQSGSLREDSQA
jgi:hypothetical protein